MRLPLKIVATGIGVGTHRVCSEELDHMLHHPAGYTQRVSGVSERRFVPPEVSQSAFAATAVRAALSNASLGLSDFDLLLSVSGVPEQALPCTGAAISRALGLPAGTPTFDINASCIGFLSGLQVAGALLQSRQYRRIVLVASDLASRGVDWQHPEASFIFGDGAAAAVLEAGDGSAGIDAFSMETHPEGFEHCQIRAGGTRRNPRQGCVPQDFLFHMDGRAVFRLASKVLPGLVSRVLEQAGRSLADMALFVPHQASHLGLSHMVSRLGLDAARTMTIYPTHGNQVSASIPTALHTALDAGRAVAGNQILLLGTGAGFAAGAAVVTL